jgi:hypothetical protein
MRVAMSSADPDGALIMTESPSLTSPFTQDPPAYEMKFLLRDAQAAEVIAWARERLTPDAHADPVTGGYLIHTLYFDTHDQRIFRRLGSYKRCKYRVRRYGSEPLIYLERKMKIGDRVRKRRIAIPQAELACLEYFRMEPDWPGRWFQQRLWARSLKPAYLMSYERAAYIGANSEGPLRLTLDRCVTCSPQPALNLEAAQEARLLLSGRQVLELKFRGWMPALFRRLVAEFSLQPTALSKYQIGVQTFGLNGAANNQRPE